MNPEQLVQSFWDDLNRDLLYLALLHLSVVTFAGAILFARAVVPSLVYTGHAPPRASKLRPIIFAVAAIAGLAAVSFAFLWIGNLGFLYDIYDRTYY